MLKYVIYPNKPYNKLGVCKWLQKLSSDHVIVSPLIYLYLLFSTFIKIRVFFTGIILLVVRLSKPSIIPLCKNVVVQDSLEFSVGWHNMAVKITLLKQMFLSSFPGCFAWLLLWLQAGWLWALSMSVNNYRMDLGRPASGILTILMITYNIY